MQPSQAMTDALTRTITACTALAPDAAVALTQLRASSQPDNGFSTAELAWPVRGALAEALRAQAAAGDPEAAALTGLADALDESVRARLASHTGQRF